MFTRFKIGKFAYTATPLIFGAVLLTTSNALAASPSFDCAKASHEIELLICKDETLAKLDHKLADTFAQAVARVKEMPNSKTELKNMKAYQRGWIGGRNDCWKAEEKRQCTLDSYQRRIAELQARYMLVKAQKPVFYTCNDNPADEIVATFMESAPSSVRLERGDRTEIAIQSISADGARYTGDFGLELWTKGNNAMVTWPQGTQFNCTSR